MRRPPAHGRPAGARPPVCCHLASITCSAPPVGLIANIQRFALHDGPGIRTTFYLKGCPLGCLWCQNPETLSPRPQLLFTRALCSRCGVCERVCAQGVHAIDKGDDGGHRVAFDRCVACGQCAAACPHEALLLIGREMGVDELVAVALKDKDYYDQSGGGVTLSGGEPLAQPEFALAAVQALARAGFQTALDTSGHAPPEAFDAFIGAAALLLFDLKAADPERHRRLTGVGNEWIVRNLREAVARGAHVVVRIPLVPGCNDDKKELERMAGVLAALPPPVKPPVQFLPYHDYARHKYEGLGMTYQMPGDARRPSSACVAAAKALFVSHGLSVIEEL